MEPTQFDTLRIQTLKKWVPELKEYETIYPATIVNAIFSNLTGLRLDRLLQCFNSVYINWLGEFTESVKQIPIDVRKRGIIATYHDAYGNIHTIRYNGIIFEDDEFLKEENWEASDFNIFKDLFKIVDEIFSHINRYPEFQTYLENFLREYASGVTVDECRLIFQELLQNLDDYPGIKNLLIELINQYNFGISERECISIIRALYVEDDIPEKIKARNDGAEVIVELTRNDKVVSDATLPTASEIAKGVIRLDTISTMIKDYFKNRDIVGTDNIKDGAITADKLDQDLFGQLSDKNVDSDNIADGSITEDKLSPEVREKLQSASDYEFNLTPDCIETIHIKDKNVTKEKLADDVLDLIKNSSGSADNPGSIPGGNLQDGTVGGDKLEDSTVTGNKLADKSVERKHISDELWNQLEELCDCENGGGNFNGDDYIKKGSLATINGQSLENGGDIIISGGTGDGNGGGNVNTAFGLDEDAIILGAGNTNIKPSTIKAGDLVTTINIKNIINEEYITNIVEEGDIFNEYFETKIENFIKEGDIFITDEEGNLTIAPGSITEDMLSDELKGKLCNCDGSGGTIPPTTDPPFEPDPDEPYEDGDIKHDVLMFTEPYDNGIKLGVAVAVGNEIKKGNVTIDYATDGYGVVRNPSMQYKNKSANAADLATSGTVNDAENTGIINFSPFSSLDENAIIHAYYRNDKVGTIITLAKEYTLNIDNYFINTYAAQAAINFENIEIPNKYVGTLWPHEFNFQLIVKYINAPTFYIKETNGSYTQQESDNSGELTLKIKYKLSRTVNADSVPTEVYLYDGYEILSGSVNDEIGNYISRVGYERETYFYIDETSSDRLTINCKNLSNVDLTQKYTQLGSATEENRNLANRFVRTGANYLGKSRSIINYRPVILNNVNNGEDYTIINVPSYIVSNELLPQMFKIYFTVEGEATNARSVKLWISSKSPEGQSLPSGAPSKPTHLAKLLFDDTFGQNVANPGGNVMLTYQRGYFNTWYLIEVSKESRT